MLQHHLLRHPGVEVEGEPLASCCSILPSLEEDLLLVVAVVQWCHVRHPMVVVGEGVQVLGLQTKELQRHLTRKKSMIHLILMVVGEVVGVAHLGSSAGVGVGLHTHPTAQQVGVVQPFQVEVVAAVLNQAAVVVRLLEGVDSIFPFLHPLVCSPMVGEHFDASS